MNKPINTITANARKAAFISPEEAEAITARRHHLRSQLCMRGWDWHAADAEAWHMAKQAQFGADPLAAAMAVFKAEAA